jgi:hypothetical protein
MTTIFNNAAFYSKWISVESTLGGLWHEDVYDDKSTKVEGDCKAVLDTWKILGKRWSLLN